MLKSSPSHKVVSKAKTLVNFLRNTNMTNQTSSTQDYSGQEIGPLDYKEVANAQVYVANAVSYQGSPPFCGFFETFDVDECIRYEPDGRKFIYVDCQWEDQESEQYLELELHGNLVQSIVGHDGEVVSRIGRIIQG